MKRVSPVGHFDNVKESSKRELICEIVKRSAYVVHSQIDVRDIFLRYGYHQPSQDTINMPKLRRDVQFILPTDEEIAEFCAIARQP